MSVKDKGYDFSVEHHTERMTINMGPSHPATHGTVRFLLTLDGEIIEKCDVEIGYLHRAFEKECENQLWTGVFPYTDRLDYTASVANNVGYALAVEKLIGIETPERCQYIRTIISELARLSGHYTNLGAAAAELGAITAFIYLIKAREMLWDVIESVCGARLTHNYVRIGGVAADLPASFESDIKVLFKKNRALWDDYNKLLTKNRIFLDRMRDVGGLSQEDAISWGFTGPCLRACGVPYDVRKAEPYLVYDQLDFDIPVGSTGDNFDRYLVRMEEVQQSMKIVEQCIEKMPEGPVNIDDPKWRQPSKDDSSTRIESMIHHFKCFIQGQQVPKGEAYFPVEAPNGELGFYLISNGGGQPVKCRVRAPSFALTAAMPQLVKGHLMADLIPTFDMINLIGGECDR
ncbi:NADH-ubiquinone oxidoreductase chain D [hydrothermal vent metagenome]|uniref:NADH-ubiquinone oxidoreductase chain D n=1 Tax=hydrothermal vent metagenome TaxID=652676 RepID=A0A3B1C5J4_9ZZZZ